MDGRGDNGAGDSSVGGSAAAVVTGRLRELILRGELAPGTVLSQVALSEELGVSRTPLREALRRLQAEGLIEGEPQRRVRVAGFNPHDLDAVYGARIALETAAMIRAVPLMTDGDLAALRSDLDRMIDLSVGKDRERWEAAHGAFHRRLIVKSGPAFVAAIAPFVERADRYRKILMQMREPRGWEHVNVEHRSIVDACCARTPAAAALELARHLARTALTLNAELSPESDAAIVRGSLAIARCSAEHEAAGLDAATLGPRTD